MDDISEDLKAAYKFVEGMVRSADYMHGSAPLWYGWALRKAFLVGVQRGREVPAETEATEREVPRGD